MNPQQPTRTHSIPFHGPPWHVLDNEVQLKQHPGYVQAKSGDVPAAVALITDLALPFLCRQLLGFAPGCVFVAPHAREASGDNAIPQVLAETAALVFDGMADTEIVQATQVFHTGADPMERLALRPCFEGDVIAGARYVLVDDVTNLGGTLAELADHIQHGGGLVEHALVLVNAGRNQALKPDKKTLNLIEKRYPNGELTTLFGIANHALTANEASYLVGFRSVGEIRNRLAKARQEIHLRLRSKGIGATHSG
jgi:hypothetical protein